MVWVLCNSILSFYTHETLKKYNIPVQESSIWNYTAPKLAPTSPEIRDLMHQSQLKCKPEKRRQAYNLRISI